ncbi:MAG: hypothetical protein K6G82_03730 [Ruminococcus sp.]|nr:hypothetical protein [Ruminococcus sp.]
MNTAIIIFTVCIILFIIDKFKPFTVAMLGCVLMICFGVLKKGGTFAIHDIMSKSRYGDMQEFVNELYNDGYEVAELINTTDGMFMSKGEAKVLGLSGSSLLVGRK